MHLMKKLLAVFLILVTTVALSSCNTPDTDELIGTYELSELTGTTITVSCNIDYMKEGEEIDIKTTP